MTIQGVSHLPFVVRDLERTSQLMRIGLGAQEVYDSKDRQFSIARERFHVDEAELAGYEQRLQALGVEIKPPRPRVSGEGLSLYFYDHDNHPFGLHTGTLQERLQRYAR